MKPTRGAGRRLSVEDWVQAGFALLADDGPTALRVDKLCERLNVTKGSFYWHFADIATFRTELTRAWGSLQDEHRHQFDVMPDGDPRDRLKVMMTAVMGAQLYALERAMRVWALTDTDVAASVRDADGRVLRAVFQAFVDAGFEPDDAAVRAVTFFAAGMGMLHGIDPTLITLSVDASIDNGPDRFLDFILRP